MLKSQDIMILLKMVSSPDFTQSMLAMTLYISQSEVSAARKRLKQAGLIEESLFGSDSSIASKVQLKPIISTCIECLVHGVKYFFPVELGTESPGIVTSYAAPVLSKKLVLGNSSRPVWPHIEGKEYGLALKPLYPSVPKSVIEYPDILFYDLLTIVDALRSGRARERKIAAELLAEKLRYQKEGGKYISK